MVVQHNLTAMNSNRMLGLTTSAQAKSTEKLSSGYKINRAADDAAGLSISEKMRKQIRGLTQASANAEDGISAVQTAEGALNEVQDMLQRMNELAVKASNGTMSEDDRASIQSEINQLVTEIDRVSTTTKFNETYLLKGNNNGEAGKLTYDDASDKLSDIGTVDAQGLIEADMTAEEDSTDDIDSLDNTVYDCVSIEIGDKTYVYIKSTSAEDPDDDTESASVSQVIEEINSADTDTKEAYSSMDALMSAIKSDYAKDIKAISSYVDESGNTKLKVEAFADLNDAVDVSLHVGADGSDDNKITMNIAMMSARGLGINGLKVDGATTDNATKAIDTIEDALKQVSAQRSTLGAIQNRLEHTINNLDNVVENTTSAESAIRDTDMASEMVSYSNNNILAQAGQSMLAQANQSNQGVLSLLG